MQALRARKPVPYRQQIKPTRTINFHGHHTYESPRCAHGNSTLRNTQHLSFSFSRSMMTQFFPGDSLDGRGCIITHCKKLVATPTLKVAGIASETYLKTSASRYLCCRNQAALRHGWQRLLGNVKFRLLLRRALQVRPG